MKNIFSRILYWIFADTDIKRPHYNALNEKVFSFKIHSQKPKKYLKIVLQKKKKVKSNHK